MKRAIPKRISSRPERTLEEWIDFHLGAVEKATNDIFKNLKEDGAIQTEDGEIDDIRQQVLCFVIERYISNGERLNAGYIYKSNFWVCKKMFTGIERGVPALLMDPSDFLVIPAPEKDELTSEDRIIDYIDMLGGMADRNLDIEFSLWWIGEDPARIAAELTSANIPNSSTQRTIYNRIKKTVKRISEKTGITELTIRAARDYNLKKLQLLKDLSRAKDDFQ
mgnify:CR=1 FL=1